MTLRQESSAIVGAAAVDGAPVGRTELIAVKNAPTVTTKQANASPTITWTNGAKRTDPEIARVKTIKAQLDELIGKAPRRKSDAELRAKVNQLYDEYVLKEKLEELKADLMIYEARQRRQKWRGEAACHQANGGSAVKKQRVRQRTRVLWLNGPDGIGKSTVGL